MSKVFISYSHEDEKWKDRVVKQLGVLAHEGKLEVWDDRRIAGGDDWLHEIEEAIHNCDVALLLISAAFLTSKFILGQEIPPLLERRARDGVRVFPVILSPCAWKHVSWLKGIHARPIDGKSLSSMTRNKAESALSALAEEVLQLTSVPEPTPMALPTHPSTSNHISPTRLSHGAEHLFGREAELELLDQAWANPATHILTFVAFGGVGKTSLLIEWMARKAAAGWPGMERVFDWSFYSQGTREQGSPSADIFIKEALTFFGDRVMAESPASAWDKGARLAQLVAEKPTLLVLDGLEPLQYPPGPMAGKLKDPIIETLLKGLNRLNPGLCIITTRDSLEDLKAYRDTTAPERKLEFLCDVAGAAVLHQAGAQRAGAVGIKADDVELQAASREVAGHALTLKLLGNYLSLAANGDIRRRSEVRFEEADREYGAGEDKPYGHAFKVMSAYEKWFAEDGKDGRRKIAALRLLGLFDGPADVGCIEALRKPPAIRGLTEELADQGRAKWIITLAHLARCGLVAIRDNNTLDSHPLIREYFAKQLRDHSSAAWRSGHKRLFEYLTKSTMDKLQPTLNDLQPLYQAVTHGCLAGMYQKALDEVYIKRILRGPGHYSIDKLGAYGTELGVINFFFEQPWSQISSSLSEDVQAWLPGQAAYCLRALGRLGEALQTMRVDLEMHILQKSWKRAAIAAHNLSELELTLGWMGEALNHAQQSVGFADRSGDAFQPVHMRTTLADTLSQVARQDEALMRFRVAESMQTKIQPDFPLLYSVQGFQYCDLLLIDVERICWKRLETCMQMSEKIPPDRDILLSEAEVFAEVILEVDQRTKQTFKWANDFSGSLLDFGLGHLNLGRGAFCQATLIDTPSPEKAAAMQVARKELTHAVNGLRQAGSQHYIPRGLLFRAWLRFVDGDPANARADLDAAWEIAVRGPMRLYMADIHLYRARLFQDKDELIKARAMIEECGYWRRKVELEDAEAAAWSW